MPHFVVLIHGGPGDPTPDELTAHDRHASDRIGSGSLVAAFAFGPEAETVRIDADGPTTAGETATPLDGIGVIEAPDLEAAVAIAQQNPATAQGGFVEVRPVLGSWARDSGSASGSGSGSAHGVPGS